MKEESSSSKPEIEERERGKKEKNCEEGTAAGGSLARIGGKPQASVTGRIRLKHIKKGRKPGASIRLVNSRFHRNNEPHESSGSKKKDEGQLREKTRARPSRREQLSPDQKKDKNV